MDGGGGGGGSTARNVNSCNHIPIKLKLPMITSGVAVQERVSL